jgi:hypothetical protein
MIFFFMLLVALVGVVVGAAAARYYQQHLTPDARTRRNHLDAIALLRDLQYNPDAATLRVQAAKIIAAFDQDVAPRKDT